MITWSNPNALLPDQPISWILRTLRSYLIIAVSAIALAFGLISLGAGGLYLYQHLAPVSPSLSQPPGQVEGTGTSAGELDRSQHSSTVSPSVSKPPIGVGTIDREGLGTMVILIVMIILFGAATYFTGRYGKAGYTAYATGFVVVCITLAFLKEFGIFG